MSDFEGVLENGANNAVLVIWCMQLSGVIQVGGSGKSMDTNSVEKQPLPVNEDQYLDLRTLYCSRAFCLAIDFNVAH